MKYVYLVLSLIFILFAAVQYNDPDPYIWAPYYLAIALICFFKFKGQYYSWLVISMLVISVAWAASYLPSVLEWWKMGRPDIADHMKAETPYIENMREFSGLVICIAAIVPVYLKKNPST